MALTLASNAITFTDSTALSSGIITSAQLSAGAVQESFANTSGAFSFRNKIINGNFDIWQRGTSFSADGYGADRWYNGRTGTACTMSREIFTLGQTDVPSEPTYFCRMTVSSVNGSSNNARLRQLIEGVRTLAGKTLTVSFYAKADAAKTIALDLNQDFGSGGSPSSNVSGIGVQKFNLTTSWQKFTATISVPSISGKTLGTNNDSSIGLLFWFDAGSDLNSRTDSLGQQSGTFDIAQVQLEEGPVATPFEQRPIGLELSLCQRYYQKSSSRTDGSNAFSINGGDALGYYHPTGNFRFGYKFPIIMRSTPNLKLYDSVGTIDRVSWYNTSNNTWTNNGTIFLQSATPTGIYVGASIANGGEVQFNFTADAEL